ncbi:hypothetical protein [Psychrobacillus faecigallinarum]|nr:hypothetical protein [Psychrobacillus faecigallinarum]
MKNMPSIETQHEMVRFLMKSVIPRMIKEKRLKDKQREDNQK